MTSDPSAAMECVTPHASYPGCTDYAPLVITSGQGLQTRGSSAEKPPTAYARISEVGQRLFPP